MQTTINSQVALALDQAKSNLLKEQDLKIAELSKKNDELDSRSEERR